MDANHLLYLVRACQLFVTGHGNSLREGLKDIKAKTLFLPASTDLLLMPYMAENAYSLLKDMNKDSAYAELDGNMGHLEGVVDVDQQSQRLASFLTEKPE